MRYTDFLLFKVFYKIIDQALDDGFNYERLVWCFNPYQIAEPCNLPQVWLRKETLVLQMFAPKLHALVIGPPGIGKTSITDFLNDIRFPFDRATMVGGDTGAVTTAAGLRDSITNLYNHIRDEFPQIDRRSIKKLPKAILHLEEFLRCPKYIRDVLKPVMSDFVMIIKHSRKSLVRGSYLAPVNIYADTNPPGADNWIGNDFNSKKEQLKELANESAYIRRFGIVLILDNYTPEQNTLIRAYIEKIRVEPHDAIASGELFEKYSDFVFQARQRKVKPTPVPESVYKIIMYLEEQQRAGKFILPIIYTDYVDVFFNVAEAIARINDHKEITEEDWSKAVEYVWRTIETVADIPRSSKEALYRRALRVSNRISEELKKMDEYISEKYNIK